MLTLQVVPVPNPAFCVRKLGEETVVLAERGDMIHVLDDMGTEIWQCIDGHKNLAEILAFICSEWEVEPSVAEADLKTFVADLVSKDIVVLQDKK